MKDKQLYRCIQKILEETRNLKADGDPKLIAQKYVKQQMIKKKLIPIGSDHKINHVMKRFCGLNSYVDLADIMQSERFSCFVSKKQSKHVQDTRISLPQFSKPTIQGIIQEKLSQVNFTKFESENKLLHKLIDNLEQNSKIVTENLKNNSAHDENTILKELERQKDQNRVQFVSESSSKMLKQLIQQQNIDVLNFCKMKGSKIQQNKKYADLLHKASTYLHIILQNQHRAKWYVNKNQTNFRYSKSKYFNIRKSKGDSKIKNKNNANSDLTNTQNTSNRENSNFSQIGKLSTKKKVIKEFTFQKRNHKQGALNRINSFIGQIDNEQYIIKKQNSLYLKTLKKVEDSANSKYSEFKEEPVANDNDIEEILKVAANFRLCNIHKKL